MDKGYGICDIERMATIELMIHETRWGTSIFIKKVWNMPILNISVLRAPSHLLVTLSNSDSTQRSKMSRKRLERKGASTGGEGVIIDSG